MKTRGSLSFGEGGVGEFLFLDDGFFERIACALECQAGHGAADAGRPPGGVELLRPLFGVSGTLGILADVVACQLGHALVCLGAPS